MNSLEIRKKFFDFFVKHGHEKISSSSLIPAQDPTLLFTNAGMNQFKDLFLGTQKQSYTTATTVQKCVRAGGKHNDLDNVGFTKRHLTFFEMMGNFSFGDYFKKEAISFAWDLLTNGYKISPSDMYVSVYKEDQEAFDLWHTMIGVPKERIMRFDKKDNFWQMGDTGPCGPCTEIYIDLRSTQERRKAPTYDDFEAGKLLEIWNLVFMQFNQQEDGQLIPLKQTGVDTGMGLERLACILQGKDSVFQTDLFTGLIAQTERLTGVSYADSNDNIKAAFHVLADHVRSSSLIIADGGTPSNEGRGYVLRKIIRRAALFTQKLTDKNIFPQLAECFIKEMGTVYPELLTNKALIVELLTYEIEQFAQNLIRGQAILETFFKKESKTQLITGEQAFKLYDTYGFPLEVTILASQENGFKVDKEAFEACMEIQRQLSGKKMKSTKKTVELDASITTEFVGYEQTSATSKISAILVDEKPVESVEPGTPCALITQTTPFFAATGGQVDDTGTLTIHGKQAPLEGLQKLNNGQAIAARITAPTKISLGDTVLQEVDRVIRAMTMNNHTATHLLQAALIELLGKQVKQSGSVVTPEYLRFDFTYHKNLDAEQIRLIENRVNEKIRENIDVEVFETTYKKAIDRGVIAIFGEKYNPEKVRVVDVPGFSAELCGGTHVPATGAIGIFKITEVTALSAGNRRIFASTGPCALTLMQENFNAVKALSQKFKVKPEQVVTTVEKQTEQLNELEKALKLAKKENLKTQLVSWGQKIKTFNNVPFLSLLVENYTADELKDIATLLSEKQPGLYCLVSNNVDKSVFFVTLSKQFEQSVNFKLLTEKLQTFGLKGGGKPGTLQGGGPIVSGTLETVCTESIA